MHSDREPPAACPVSASAESFDPFSDAYQQDPPEYVRWAREQEPIFYSPVLGYWIVTRYDDIKAIFRDNLTFSPSIALEKITPTAPDTHPMTYKKFRRAIPVATQREIWQQANGTCQYRDSQSSRRCEGRYQLQLEHVTPVAFGGSNRPENLRLYCRSHNWLSARQATLA